MANPEGPERAGPKRAEDERRRVPSGEALYAAFISYTTRSRRDTRIAARLRRRLRSYRATRRIRKKYGPGVQKQLKVFRDRDVGLAGDLTPELEKALDSSESLVVVCSPDAATHRWVNQEISYFQEQNRQFGLDRPSIPVLAAGQPDDPRENPLPRGLMLSTGPDLREDPSKPWRPLLRWVLESLGFRPRASRRGPDWPAESDSLRRATVVIVSEVTGLPFEELWREEQRRQRSMATLLIATLAAVSAAALPVFPTHVLPNRALAAVERGQVSRGARLASWALQLSDAASVRAWVRPILAAARPHNEIRAGPQPRLVLASGVGGMLAMQTLDGRISLWETNAGQPRFRSVWQGQPMVRAALSETGTLIGVVEATPTSEGIANARVELWSSRATESQLLAEGDETYLVAVATQASFAATVRVYDRSLLLWQADADVLGLTVDLPGLPVALAMSPAGRFVAVAGRTEVQVYDRLNGRWARSPLPTPPAEIAFSPEGSLLVVATEDGRLLSLDPMRTQEVCTTSALTDQEVEGLAVGGWSVAALQGTDIHIWDVAACRPLGVIAPGERRLQSDLLSVGTSGGANVFVTSGAEREADLWLLGTAGRATRLTTLRSPERIRAVRVLSQDQRASGPRDWANLEILTVDAGGLIRVWRPLEAGDPLRVPGGWPTIMSDDLTTIVTFRNTTSTAEVWRHAEGRLSLRSTLSTDGRPAGTLSPDGGSLLLYGTPSDPLLCNLDSLRCRPIRTSFQVVGAVFAPDGNRLALGGMDGRLEVLNPTSAERRVLRLSGEWPTEMRFASRGGRLLTRHADGTAVRWHLGNERIDTVGGPVLAAFFTSGGPDVLTVSLDQEHTTFRILRASGGDRDEWLHPRLVSTIASTGDGETLVAGDDEGGVTLWENVGSSQRRQVDIDLRCAGLRPSSNDNGHTAPQPVWASLAVADRVVVGATQSGDLHIANRSGHCVEIIPGGGRFTSGLWLSPDGRWLGASLPDPPGFSLRRLATQDLVHLADSLSSRREGTR